MDTISSKRKTEKSHSEKVFYKNSKFQFVVKSMYWLVRINFTIFLRAILDVNSEFTN